MATITTAKSGLWSDPTTWTGGVLPATGDQVEINHTITYDLDNRNTIYARININAGGALIHDNTKKTTIVSTHYIYVNGGKYQAGPNSETLFKTTSNSSGTEGVGLAGIYAVGGTNNTQVIMQGSLPMPETSLTTAVVEGDVALRVQDASQFAKGEFIAVYRDISGDSSWGWSGTNQSDEGFVIHHIVGNDIYIEQRVAVEDKITSNMAIGSKTCTVPNAKKFQVGMKVWIDDELFTIQSINEAINTLTFTSAATVAHNTNARIVETGAQKAHAIGDKVYKIATVTTSSKAINSTTIDVANAAMLNVGDRILIEGTGRSPGFNATNSHETTITTKNGNTLTLATPIPNTTDVGYIVTKTNRDCVVGTLNPTDDSNRCFVYYTYGSSSVTGRKCVFRYVEFSRTGNSYTEVQSGVCIRGDFNRSDTEREFRGCVIRDGRGVGRNGLWAYSAHHMVFRNNVLWRTCYGINTYDQNGASFYNNISAGSSSSAYRCESQYYYNQFQYNIGLNSQYPVLYYSSFVAAYPEWHNLFRHHERGLYFPNSAISCQYGPWMKNRYQDVYYLQGLSEGTRIIVQDIDFIPVQSTTASNWSSSYGNYDERGLYSGMLVIVNKNFERGNFEMHGAGGIIYKDTTVHMGNGWSYKFACNHASIDLRISEMIYVRVGIPVTVRAYMRKDNNYNGSVRPCIVVKGMYQPRIQQEMANVNNEWVRVELTFTPSRSEMVQIGVGARGTSGNAWIDPRVSVTTHDLDLINGPYSVNLMFGLEEYRNTPASLTLGGGMTL